VTGCHILGEGKGNEGIVDEDGPGVAQLPEEASEDRQDNSGSDAF